MEYGFKKPNNKFRDTELYTEVQISDELWEKELYSSKISGLIPDFEHNIYVREGYGALVGWCPNNCSTMEQLFNYTYEDRFRKVASKPNLKELLMLIQDRINNIGGGMFYTSPTDYFGYKRKTETLGMDLVIGPGGYFEGNYWEKAVYCQNYKQLLGISEKIK